MAITKTPTVCWGALPLPRVAIEEISVGSGLSLAGGILSASGGGGGGSGDVVKIAEVVLTSDTAAFNFTSIPNTYRHLILEGDLQNDNSIYGGIYATFNGDTGSNYDKRILEASGTSVTTNHTESVGYVHLGYCNSANLGIEFSSAFDCQIPNYVNSIRYKNTQSRSNMCPYGAQEMYYGSGMWRSTSAITTLNVFTNGLFKAGSTLTLLGIN